MPGYDQAMKTQFASLTAEKKYQETNAVFTPELFAKMNNGMKEIGDDLVTSDT